MRKVAQLSEQERKELFTETVSAMNITAAATEKDFWICWVLLNLFEDEQLSRYLRFKGGTSLSKCYNSIQRFSEDIDLILDWTQLTEENPVDQDRSKTQQNRLNQAINEHAQDFIANTLMPRLNELMGELCELEVDIEDPHTINISYPKAFDSEYLRPQVRFYSSGWANYGKANLAELVLQPSEHHIEALKTDYEQMQEMLFGAKPSFAQILETLVFLEREIHELAEKN